MTSKRNEFSYRASQTVSGWGFRFDSLTELKYAISIIEDYHFLRSPVSIYFHPGSKMTTDRISLCNLRYTPDFLIRHKRTHKASLIEIKPRAFENHPQLVLRKAIAENYINRKKLDWKFQVVFDDKIMLDQAQLEDFETAASLTTSTDITKWFKEYRQHFQVPTRALHHIDWIFYGPKRCRPLWKQITLL